MSAGDWVYRNHRPMVAEVEEPPPDEAVCQRDERSLVEECTVAVPLRIPGTAAIDLVLRDASREEYASQETTLRRETFPDGFVVGVRARAGPNSVWTRVRRVDPGHALVHHHVFTPTKRACVILRYQVRPGPGIPKLEEASETRAVFRSGAPVAWRSARGRPLAFLSRYALRQRRSSDLREILGRASSPRTAVAG
jgi:hypothetical protein